MQVQATGYFSTTQSAGTANSHPLGTSLHSTHHSLFHRPAVSNPALHLLSYGPGHQIGIKLRLLNLLDVQLNLLADKLLKVASHFIDSLSAPPNDDTRPGGMDS